MFKCQVCKEDIRGQRPQRVVAERRDVVYDGPETMGWEIAREVVACATCAPTVQMTTAVGGPVRRAA